MGARLTCACPESYCVGSDNDIKLRLHAELFELSADSSKWILADPRLVHVTVLRQSPQDPVRVTVVSQSGKTLLDTTITQGQQIERISECFVFWKDSLGKTVGVNTLSGREASVFLAHCTARPAPVSPMLQHNVMAQVTLIASFNGTKIERRNEPVHCTMVSINPLNMVFHYNHGLVNIDLLECFGCVGSSPSVLHLSYATNMFSLEFPSEADKFIKQVLNMSSLLLSRTTCTEVALSYLQRQRLKTQDKIAALNPMDSELNREKLLLKDFAMQHRIASLTNAPLPGIEDLAADVVSAVAADLLPENSLVSLFLFYANMYNFRLWRKAVDVRMADLQALCSPTDPVMTLPGSSTSQMMTVHLPNGKTIALPHESDANNILLKVCDRVAVSPDLYDLHQIEDNQWRLNPKDEYQVEKKHGKLGLTIYAHNDCGTIRAEVRGVAAFAPQGAAIGDAVLSVDGKLIAQVKSAGDVEKLLRDGRIIRLRRKVAPDRNRRETTLDRSLDKQDVTKREASKERQLKWRTIREDSITRTPTTEQPPSLPTGASWQVPPPVDSRAKMNERLLRGLEELLTTEQKYVQDLNQMIDRFLSIRAVNEIMESAHRLKKMQISFLESIEEAIGDILEDGNSRQLIRDAVMRVSALFVNRCGEFKVYAEYAASYLRLLQEISTKKDLLASLETANQSGEQHCSYESRMIRPIQRVVQYPLLLRALLAACESSSLEAKQVEGALQKMQTLAEYVNEMQRIHEKFAPLIESAKKAHEVVLKEKCLRIDIRDLLIFAHIRWINTEKTMQDQVVFVFHSLVLLLPAQPRRDLKAKWMRILPINEVEVEDSRGDESLLVLVHVAFRGPNGQLSHGNPEAVYHLACCQPRLKLQLVKSIRKARSNYVRETKRPLSGSSQSDGGYGSDPSKERKNS